MTTERTAGKIRGVVAAFLRMSLAEELRFPMPFVLKQVGFVAPLAIYFFVARLIGDSDQVGGDYFTFVVIGLVVTRMLHATLGGFGADLQRAQNRGSLEAWLVEPIPWLALPFAMSLWSIVEGVVSGAIIFAVSLLLGARYEFGGVLSTLALLALGLMASSAMGILIAGQTLVAKRASPILQVYNLAASILGGMLFPVTLLPAWLRALSWLIPHTYVINAARSALMIQPVAGEIEVRVALTALAVFCIIVLPLGLFSLSRWLKLGRRLGVLGGY